MYVYVDIGPQENKYENNKKKVLNTGKKLHMYLYMPKRSMYIIHY